MQTVQMQQAPIGPKARQVAVAYGAAATLLRDKREQGLLQQALNELGDLQLANCNSEATLAEVKVLEINHENVRSRALAFRLSRSRSLFFFFF